MDALIVIWHNLDYLLWGAFPDGPLGGAALTLLLSIGSAVASAVLGALLGIALTFSRGVVGHALTLVLAFLRAIPVLMLIFWTYFLLPIVFGLDVPGLLPVMCALSLISAAYLAHAVHAGILAIPAGQWDAGYSVGFTRGQVLRYVVLPQALRMMVPSFVNQWITLIKDTSLAYIVGVSELSTIASQVSNRVMIHPVPIFLFAGAIYFVICAALDWAAGRAARGFTQPA
ncbi:amino acid ABC transporter permease [Silvimonas soli]|uniref:amino acid ABC transporter permease n=1 Tax=Silvimonas soli TaxID=2980100 RepID=UPI0024B354DF|nr:amino acid ABC transporter permease [Silvimonas soli]